MPNAIGARIMEGDMRSANDKSERSEVVGATRNQATAATPSRRQVFALAAVLAATSLTGVAAIAGLQRRVPPAPTAPRVGQVITPATPAAPRRAEPGD